MTINPRSLLNEHERDTLDRWFNHGSLEGIQVERYHEIQKAANNLAATIILNTHRTVEQEEALMHVRKAMMMAMAAMLTHE